MGVRADPGSFRWCQALSRSRSFATRQYNCLIATLLLLTSTTNANNPSPGQQDAIHITAILGESVVFNCHVEFPSDNPVPFVLQWEKKGQEIPIYIWYENYPTHSGEGYEGRVSRVSTDSQFGAASLNLTNIRETDQGWYECKVVFLNRSPSNQHKNGSWFHLDVHAPPRFSVTPEDIVYVNLGDSIILNCQADGTPTPEILWYKDANPVDPSSTVGIFNDGTELRISSIRSEDIGDYTCIARNGEGQVSHTARVIIAGGAVIMVPPTNQTKLEGEKATFTCEAKAMPGNVTVRWFREGAPVREVASLETRVTIRKDGSLIINPVSADDSGQYLCEVSNGIGDPQSASAYLNVEYPAKVTFTPTVQYLPFRLAGVVQCYIKANPNLQYVTWTKDKRLLEPYQTKDIVIMNNGSLLFTRVNQNHQGRYTCTPYNAQGTQGSSGPMEVLVRKPPVFNVEPDPLYQRKVGESVEMHCDAQEAEGTQRPNIQWQRRDGLPLQRNRVKALGGNITIENLRRSDFGYYQCVASNEVATIVSATQLVIEGTQPHAPYNVSGTATEFSVTMSWMPGYSGGPDYKQEYTLWYREAGISDWSTIPVTPSGSTQVTINRLSPGTTYEFQVVGKNALGDGMMSKVVTIRTLDAAKAKPNVKTSTSTTSPNDHSFKEMPDEADIKHFNEVLLPTDSNGSTYLPPIFRSSGPKPGQPRNLTVTEIPNGFLISWQQPLERANLVQYYTIKYRTDAQWKTLNRGQIRPEDTSYLVKNLVGGRTYYFRVLANSVKSYESSEEVKFPVPARVKHKAITAGVVGGILFFIVAIILSICAVKICNKRKRRKQEKAYNMVACRITDARSTSSRMGSASSSQVPLKKYRQSRIPGLKSIFAIIHWIWPVDRCTNCHSIYSITPLKQNSTKNLDQIHRSADGRFILSIDETDMVIRSGSVNSENSGSDDGGFLPKHNRRLLITSPREMSIRSHLSGDDNSFTPRSHGGLLSIGRQASHNIQSVPIQYNGQPIDQNLHINTSRESRFVSSSPVNSNLTVMRPSAMYFNDLSSVLQPNSAERSFPMTRGGINQLRYLQERYSQELPSLRTIHEETRRMAQGFVPLQIQMHSPSWRYSQPPTTHHHHHRHRTRMMPRHSRLARSIPDLNSSNSQLNMAMHIIEASPESRSSSSGFGSKNTSTQHNQSSQSGSTNEWRYLPPYRPPPPPPSAYHQYTIDKFDPEETPPYNMEHWLELITRLNAASETIPKAVDVGSVDGHYEFDPATPTPTASTPTGVRDDLFVGDVKYTSPYTQQTLQQRKRLSKYENIEARVQAMKEEFHAYRKRQAMRRSGIELESAC
ncbi:Protein turtle like B [Pseudolycoriella hygida]|uniref:Protein turtle like B n=1 Tax=Pseudolycoriella hygida TaxID=35572 RepID=A0A9Q0S640_9DIPT|nr:Protein turtle like B [Pseudolycoriella hygida]